MYVCMSVCVCVCVCMCMYVCTYACMHVCTYTHARAGAGSERQRLDGQLGGRRDDARAAAVRSARKDGTHGVLKGTYGFSPCTHSGTCSAAAFPTVLAEYSQGAIRVLTEYSEGTTRVWLPATLSARSSGLSGYSLGTLAWLSGRPRLCRHDPLSDGRAAELLPRPRPEGRRAVPRRAAPGLAGCTGTHGVLTGCSRVLTGYSRGTRPARRRH